MDQGSQPALGGDVLTKVQQDLENQRLYEKLKKSMHDLHELGEDGLTAAENGPGASAEEQAKVEVQVEPCDSWNAFES